MPTYITLLNFTEQGVANFRDSPKRAADFKASARKQGVQVRKVYWTLGTHDGVLIFDAPDEETATAALLGLGAGGNVRTQTLRAFDEAEFKAILGKAT